MKRLFLLLILSMAAGLATVAEAASASLATFEVRFARSVRNEPVTGRVFVAITRDGASEPRLQVGDITGAPFFGVDVSALRPGAPVRITRTTSGFPLSTLDALPPGDYWVQALLSVYCEFRRADGHVLWLHDDQWEGQQFNRAPGTLVSEPQRVHLDVHEGFDVRLELTRVLPPVVIPPDDEYVKRERIQSKLLTTFWGRPMYLGAVVLLPRIRGAPRRALSEHVVAEPFHAPSPPSGSLASARSSRTRSALSASSAPKHGRPAGSSRRPG